MGGLQKAHSTFLENLTGSSVRSSGNKKVQNIVRTIDNLCNLLLVITFFNFHNAVPVMLLGYKFSFIIFELGKW